MFLSSATGLIQEYRVEIPDDIDLDEPDPENEPEEYRVDMAEEEIVNTEPESDIDFKAQEEYHNDLMQECPDGGPTMEEMMEAGK